MRKNVAVIFGGCSPEYGVSLQSAYEVIRHMDTKKYNPILIGITRKGDWFCFSGGVQKIVDDSWHNDGDCVPMALSPSRSESALLLCGGEGVKPVHIDAAFPVLHGRNGEDGTVQGLFELAGIPVVGCGVLASALCMDKDRAHRLVHAAGVRVPRSCVLGKDDGLAQALSLAAEIGYPLFVKPVKTGSSFGISKVGGGGELSAAVRFAFEYDDRVLVEENIEGLEIGCAVLGRENLTVGEIYELELSDGFFNFEEKYSPKTSMVHVPARIDAERTDRVKEAAKLIYRVLDCRGFARVDLFLTAAGEIVFNEANTIPGFTPHSLFPRMMKAAGISFEEVLTTAIELALER